MVLDIFNKNKVYRPNDKICGYMIQEIFGEGRYGICYLVNKDNKTYVLKQLKKKMLKKVGHKVKYEEEILKNVEHSALPKFIEKIEQNNFLGYVLEFKKGKTIEEIIYDDCHVFERKEIYKIGIQIINILKYLHSKNIIHRDIRVPNVLYYSEQVYLIDFGLARFVDDKKYTLDLDFSYLGDFLLHLYYTSFEQKNKKGKAWYEELDLYENEKTFFKKLFGLEEKYKDINEIEKEFLSIYSDLNPHHLVSSTKTWTKRL